MYTKLIILLYDYGSVYVEGWIFERVFVWVCDRIEIDWAIRIINYVSY